MKINRIKLVTLLDKQDCKEFDNHIIELLKEQYSEEEIDISPNGLPPGGTNLYYWLEDNTKAWRADDHTSFPVQSVKDFLNEPIKITDVKQLRVGDRIKILEKPKSWASVLNKNCPMKLEFPFTATIKEITQDIITTYMTCGSYGWSLDAIVEAGCLLLPEGVNDTTTTQIRTITSVQAQSIIKIACDEWQQFLIKEWSKQIALGVLRSIIKK